MQLKSLKKDDIISSRPFSVLAVDINKPKFRSLSYGYVLSLQEVLTARALRLSFPVSEDVSSLKHLETCVRRNPSRTRSYQEWKNPKGSPVEEENSDKNQNVNYWNLDLIRLQRAKALRSVRRRRARAGENVQTKDEGPSRKCELRAKVVFLNTPWSTSLLHFPLLMNRGSFSS